MRDWREKQVESMDGWMGRMLGVRNISLPGHDELSHEPHVSLSAPFSTIYQSS